MGGQKTATLVTSARGRISGHRANNDDVFALDYMKFGRLVMNGIGQYPYKEFGFNTRGTRILYYYRWLVIIVTLLCEILCITYTWNRRHELDFFHLGHHYGCIITTAVLLQRLTLPFKSGFYSLLQKFITEYHLLHLEHESDFAKEEHIRIGKICRIIVVVTGLQLVFGIFSFNLMPVYTNWSNGWFSENPPQNRTLEHSVFLELPFDYTHKVGPAYYYVVMFTFVPCFNVSSGLCAYDFLIIIMVFHIWGHINILAYKLRTFPALSSQQHEEVSQDYTERTFQLLKNIIKHYQFTKRFISDISEAFEFSLCCYLAYHQLHGCVLLLEISAMVTSLSLGPSICKRLKTPEAIGKYFVLTLYVFQQLVVVCMIFEQINSKSAKLPAQVYAIPWEDLDVKNRRIVLTLLRDVQKTLSVNALGVLPVGVMTMSAIIKTTISYFLLLNTFA